MKAPESNTWVVSIVIGQGKVWYSDTVIAWELYAFPCETFPQGLRRCVVDGGMMGDGWSWRWPGSGEKDLELKDNAPAFSFHGNVGACGTAQVTELDVAKVVRSTVEYFDALLRIEAIDDIRVCTATVATHLKAERAALVKGCKVWEERFK